MITAFGAAAHPARIRRDLDGLVVDIRRSVAVRERVMDGLSLVYLSLFDDEIDARFDRVLEHADRAREQRRTSGCDGIRSAAPHVELTDVLIVNGPRGECAVVRGGSCTIPLFWSRAGSQIRLSTVLPLLESSTFSRAGLASAMAAVCHHGSYEPNAWTATPLSGWRRVRRGAITFFDLTCGTHREEAVEQGAAGPTSPQEDDVVECVRVAFAAYGRSQAGVASSIVELSGGYDSTLAAAAARSPVHVMRGISVEFPYYEFRFEAPVQRAVAAAMGIPRAVLDGTELFPFAPWQHPPRFDEPAVFVTGIRHAERVAGFATAHDATRIYVGHGGDQLFNTDLDGLEPMAASPSRAPFTRGAWRAVRQAQEPAWRRRSTGCFVYDARQDVWVKETFGPTLRTPFSDNAVFRAALSWSRLCATQGRRPDKTILARALGDLLPDAVTGRKGKVAYDGVWMRAYATHGAHIGNMLERVAGPLEHIGANPAWLLERTRLLADWAPVSNREVLAAYAVAAWLVSWGIERVSDVAWE